MAKVVHLKGMSLREMKRNMQQLPATVAVETARRVAPELTRLARESFDSGRTAYNDARPAGVDGNDLSLVKSGLTRSLLRFTAAGTIVRAVLAAKYMRYLIGKYRVLPIGDRSAVPAHWKRAIDRVFADVIAESMAGKRVA